MDRTLWFKSLGLIADTHSSWLSKFYPNGFDHTVYHVGIYLGALMGVNYFYGMSIFWAVMIHLIIVLGWIGLELWQGWKGNQEGWYKPKWYDVTRWSRERHQDWILPALFFLMIPYFAVRGLWWEKLGLQTSTKHELISYGTIKGFDHSVYAVVIAELVYLATKNITYLAIVSISLLVVYTVLEFYQTRNNPNRKDYWYNPLKWSIGSYQDILLPALFLGLLFYWNYSTRNIELDTYPAPIQIEDINNNVNNDGEMV